MQYQNTTEAAAITLSETSSLIADQLSTCILHADAHYPAQLAVCIAPGNISVLRYRFILYYGVYRTYHTDVTIAVLEDTMILYRLDITMSNNVTHQTTLMRICRL